MKIENSWVRYSFIALALLVGLFLGNLLTAKKGSNQTAHLQSSREQDSLAATKSAQERSSMISRATRPVLKEISALQTGSSYSEGWEEIQRENQSRSPLRTESLFNLHLEHSTFDEWEQLLLGGQVEGLGIAPKLARYLVRLDAERAVQFIFNNSFRLGTADEKIAFHTVVLKEAVKLNNGSMVLSEVRKVPRGGSQQFGALMFSKEWAYRQPEQAANHFEELVRLRNMQGSSRDVELPYDTFANELIEPWLKKDPQAAESFVRDYPRGLAKDALEIAFDTYAIQ